MRLSRPQRRELEALCVTGAPSKPGTRTVLDALDALREHGLVEQTGGRWAPTALGREYWRGLASQAKARGRLSCLEPDCEAPAVAGGPCCEAHTAAYEATKPQRMGRRVKSRKEDDGGPAFEGAVRALEG